MAHFATTYAGSIEAVPASGPGALAGFEFRCAGCVERAAFTSAQMTRDHAIAHTRYMREREAAPRTRRAAR